MAEILAIDAALDEDLSLFSQFLWENRVEHQINEYGGRQRVFIEKKEHLDFVLQVYQALKTGALSLSKGEKIALPKKPRPPVSYVTWSLVLLTVMGGLLLGFDPEGKYYHWLTFQDFAFYQGRLYFSQALHDMQGHVQLWRAFTPVLLHFNELHTVFNGLWVFELGRRIERSLGRFNFFMLVCLLALGSNLLQFLSTPNVRFGGMSGVIYGLLGFCFLANKIRPHVLLDLPIGIFIFMLFWLVLGFSGFFSIFGISVANWAHLSGLLLGLLLALLVVFMPARKVSPYNKLAKAQQSGDEK